MTIYKYLPKDKYTKMDNQIFTIDREKLSDGAKVVYGFLASMQIGAKITDNYIMKSLGISEPTLKKYKRQLKSLDLIDIVRVGLKQYDIYIGSTRVSASDVRKFWKIKDDGKQTSLEEIERLRNDFTFDILEIGL